MKGFKTFGTIEFSEVYFDRVDSDQKRRKRSHARENHNHDQLHAVAHFHFLHTHSVGAYKLAIHEIEGDLNM
jgi:hypothetical protein